MYIVKRDGRKVEFDSTKIEKAVLAAFKETDGEITDYAREKAKNIATYIFEKAEKSDKDLTVEEIQALVEA